jgi:Secretion system C-terminal sorting domain
LQVNGDLTLGGLLRVLVPTGASPNGAITVIECTGNITGTFASVEMPAGYAITYNAQSVVITTDGSVDNQEIIEVADFQIVPTLVENVVMITRSQSASSETNLQIFDTQGRLAFERALGKDESSVTLSLGHLVSGVYLVRVGKKVQRLVRM